jgi:hypothetical protein
MLSLERPGKQAQRRQGTGPRSHRSFHSSCGRPPPMERSILVSGRAAAAPTWPKARAGIRLPLFPPLPAPGRRRPDAEKLPPPPVRSKTSAFRVCTPHPRNFTPEPRRRAALWALHTGQIGSRTPGEGPGLPDPAPGPKGPCALKGGARRWADKRGDRQGPAYHGAAALGAHRAPQDRAAPEGRARAAP